MRILRRSALMCLVLLLAASLLLPAAMAADEITVAIADPTTLDPYTQASIPNQNVVNAQIMERLMNIDAVGNPGVQNRYPGTRGSLPFSG